LGSLFQIFGFGAVRHVEEAEAAEQIEVGGLQADALSKLGGAGELLVESDDRGGGHWIASRSLRVLARSRSPRSSEAAVASVSVASGAPRSLFMLKCGVRVLMHSSSASQPLLSNPADVLNPIILIHAIRKVTCSHFREQVSKCVDGSGWHVWLGAARIIMLVFLRDNRAAAPASTLVESISTRVLG
jgi:hypothetical protein